MRKIRTKMAIKPTRTIFKDGVLLSVNEIIAKAKFFYHEESAQLLPVMRTDYSIRKSRVHLWCESDRLGQVFYINFRSSTRWNMPGVQNCCATGAFGTIPRIYENELDYLKDIQEINKDNLRILNQYKENYNKKLESMKEVINELDRLKDKFPEEFI